MPQRRLPELDGHHSDVTSGSSKTLTSASSTLGLHAGAGAVLEQYGSVSCSDYPNDTGITFSSIVLEDQNFNVLTPTWQNITYSNISRSAISG